MNYKQRLLAGGATMLRVGIAGTISFCIAGAIVAQPVLPPVPEVHLAPPPLNTVAVPKPQGVWQYIKNRKRVIELGKAAFWDMGIGSDGQACASCHFHAGADIRIKNQLSPGLNVEGGADETFQTTASGAPGGPNYTVKQSDFPFVQFNNPDDKASGIAFQTNDAFTSQGAVEGEFVAVKAADVADLNDDCDYTAASIFHVGGNDGLLTRQAEPRNTPSSINAVFYDRLFWDGRANRTQNGVSPFGPRDVNASVWRRAGANLVPHKVSIGTHALGSQGAGPVESSLEMQCKGRVFADVARKMLQRRPLEFQEVHSQDSVLAALRHPSGFGLDKTYADMIKAAFKWRWHSSSNTVDIDGNSYSQMEANFSLFFSVAVGMYQATLISKNTPYDKFAAGQTAPFDPNTVTGPQRNRLTDAQFRGLNIFLDKGKCINCHGGPEFSNAAGEARNIRIERMPMGDGAVAIYDVGFYNIGVTPTSEDLGIGGTDNWGNPLSFTEQFISGVIVDDDLNVDPCLFEAPFDATDCTIIPADLTGERAAVRGAFKVPMLRNVALTAPHFHNGSVKNLEEVIEFYNRGGNFDNPEKDPDIQPLGLTLQEKTDLFAFLSGALTDPAAVWERRPFDHPSLRVPNGHVGDHLAGWTTADGEVADTEWLDIPAVGRGGRKPEGLPKLHRFESQLAP